MYSVSHSTMKKPVASTKNDDLFDAQRKKSYHSRAVELMRPHLSDVGRSRMSDCGDWLWMLETPDGERRKLEKGFFCGVRFCPACAWRYSMAWGRVLCAVDRFLCSQGKVPVMATLTVPNVQAPELRSTLDMMAGAWHALMKRKPYKRWKSFCRKTEVTYNRSANTYHPHYHVMIWVDPSYFSGREYISHAQLLRDWREVTGIPEITQVDLRRCRDQKQQGQAVAEVAKYVAKASDYLDENPAVFEGFYAGLKGVRIITLAGEAKKAVQAFRAGELWEFDPSQPDDLACFTHRAIYHWSGAKYDAVGREEIDLAEEKAAIAMHKLQLADDIRMLGEGWQELKGHHVGKTYVAGVSTPFDEIRHESPKSDRGSKKVSEKKRRALKRENERREAIHLERWLATYEPAKEVPPSEQA